MTAKEFLSRYIEAEENISDKLIEIAELRIKAGLVSKALQPDKVQTSGGMSFTTISDKIMDIENEVNTEIDRQREIKKEVIGAIMNVPNHRQRRVLYHRYILGMKWDGIAENMDISYQWVCTLHGRGLSQIKFTTVDSN